MCRWFLESIGLLLKSRLAFSATSKKKVLLQTLKSFILKQN